MFFLLAAIIRAINKKNTYPIRIKNSFVNNPELKNNIFLKRETETTTGLKPAKKEAIIGIDSKGVTILLNKKNARAKKVVKRIED